MGEELSHKAFKKYVRRLRRYTQTPMDVSDDKMVKAFHGSFIASSIKLRVAWEDFASELKSLLKKLMRR